MALFKATKDGNIQMTPEEEAEITEQWAENEKLIGVVRTVTMRQARLVLESEGLLAQVEALVSNSQKSVQINWEFSQNVERDDDLVVSIGNEIGLTEKQIDDLFVRAKSL